MSVTVIYIVIGVVSLIVAAYFHFKLKDQNSVIKAEKRLLETGAVAGGSCLRHGMVIVNGQLKADQKPTANYYSRLRSITTN